jgi:hypothetical protein
MHAIKLPAYLVGVVLLAAVLGVVGVPLTALLPLAALLVCPLMMVFMMKRMGDARVEDRTGHGCDHDPTRTHR